jgi:hypothetical protein
MTEPSADAMSVAFEDPELTRALASAKAWEDTAAVYARNDLDRQADVAQLRSENAGLREALEASEAECAKVIEERDRLRKSLDEALLCDAHGYGAAYQRCTCPYTQSSNPGESRG